MVIAAVFGAVAGGGVFVVALGLRGRSGDGGQRAKLRWRPLNLSSRIVLPGLAALSALAVTGWVVGAAAAAGAAVAVPAVARRSAERRRRRAVGGAVIVWVEMLRDAVVAGRGLGEALAITATLAPPPIRPATLALRARAARGPLPPALRAFADELDDPTADLLAAALTLAAVREVRDFADLLGALADTARARVRLAETADAGRAGIRTTARSIVVVAAVAVLLFSVASPDYMAPFGTIGGQIALAVTFMLFAAGAWGLHRLAEPPAAERLRLREVS